MKKTVAFITATIMALACCGCSSSDNSANSTSSEESKVSLNIDISDYSQKIDNCTMSDSNFDEYVSNTVVATGNNYVVAEADSVTYRAYFPVEQSGELDYKFYFSNMVDSTYEKTGNPAYVGKSGGAYTIESAWIADGGTSVDDEITNRTAVTFDGEAGKEVASNEKFWSDSVTFDVPDGHYLVWEWTVTGEEIPATKMSTLTSTTSCEDGDDEFSYCDEIPLPQLIGAKRDVKENIVAIGDSITQGCQTDFMAYEFWSAQISQNLGSDYSLWNCGLGWSRTSDASECGNWLARASTADTVIVAFGTNDIISGEYGGDGGNNADEILTYLTVVLETLRNANCKIIVFNAPPQNYDEASEEIRTTYNEKLKLLCEEYDAEYFDFASYLSTEDDPATAIYGGHPNGEAGKIVADAFTEKYYS